MCGVGNKMQEQEKTGYILFKIPAWFVLKMFNKVSRISAL